MKGILATIVALIFVNISYCQPWQYVYKKTLVAKPAIVKAAKDTATADTLLFQVATDTSNGIMTIAQVRKLAFLDSAFTAVNNQLANLQQSVITPVEVTTGTYILSLADNNRSIAVYQSCKVYAPPNLPAGFFCRIYREGAGTVNILPVSTAVTINSASGNTISYRFREAFLYCKAPGKYTLTGSIK